MNKFNAFGFLLLTWTVRPTMELSDLQWTAKLFENLRSQGLIIPLKYRNQNNCFLDFCQTRTSCQKSNNCSDCQGLLRSSCDGIPLNYQGFRIANIDCQWNRPTWFNGRANCSECSGKQQPLINGVNNCTQCLLGFQPSLIEQGNCHQCLFGLQLAIGCNPDFPEFPSTFPGFRTMTPKPPEESTVSYSTAEKHLKFSLPMPPSGCPETDAGERLSIQGAYKTEAKSHLDLRFWFTVCLINVSQSALPAGEYCVMNRNGLCISNMTRVDFNSASDSTNETIVLCCSTNGSADQEISLNFTSSFYLFSNSGECQKVEGYGATPEVLHWTNISSPLSETLNVVKREQGDVRFHLCYYEKDYLQMVLILCGLGILIVAVVICCCICCCVSKRKRRLKESPRLGMKIGDPLRGNSFSSTTVLVPLTENGDQINLNANGTPIETQASPLDIGSILKLILDVESQLKIHRFLIHPNKIEKREFIGKGAFGTVYQGIYKPDSNPLDSKDVAIKTLKDTVVYPEISGFIEEAIVMADFAHVNVLSLIGVCINPQTDIPMIVLPYMSHGDLQTYCRQFRYNEGFKGQKPEGTLLLSFAHQIARGMQYLAAQKFVHRDLAARNCMLDDKFTVKVADFGLTRDVYSNSYYRQDKQKLLPIKWMAIESLQDRVFTTYTDVWSYGITVWEIFTLGKVPYPDIQNCEVLPQLEKGIRLSQPQLCPDKLFEIVTKCWQEDPKTRPSFEDICTDLESMLSELNEYLDLDGPLNKADHDVDSSGKTTNAVDGQLVDGSENVVCSISEGIICSPSDLIKVKKPPNQYVDYRDIDTVIQQSDSKGTGGETGACSLQAIQ